MSFKIPRLKSKPPDRDLFSGLRRFLLDEVTDQKDIGVGSYGLVKFGRYPTDGQQSRDVVVKIPRDITGYEKEFAKEAKLLNSVKGHPNIVSFEAVSVSPFAIMTEYLKFSFEPFADQKSVNSLADFLSHVHSQYDFNGFEQVVPVIAKDVAVGLKYLHDNDIVHRDLKPANILVSNQHYTHMHGDELEFMWNNQPVVCKIADFGEGRSAMKQTQSLLSSKVQHLDRGSPAYMAPEVLLPELRPQQATLEQLKAVDTWAYGMVLFILTNPALHYPYQEELLKERSSNAFKDIMECLREILRRSRRPLYTEMYEVQQATVWNDVLNLHEAFTEFDITKRNCSMGDAIATLEGSLPSLCENINLSISQSTALEAGDYKVAKMLSDGVSISPLPAGMTVLNDATNACVFLALKVCDVLVSISAENKLKEIPHVATSVIASYPQELNEIRDISSLYTVVDANKLMRDNKHLQNNLSFTEELPYGEGVFSQISRDRLQQKLNELSHTHENFLSIYTCEPLSLLVGCIDRRLFILDTHPVPEVFQVFQRFHGDHKLGLSFLGLSFLGLSFLGLSFLGLSFLGLSFLGLRS